MFTSNIQNKLHILHMTKWWSHLTTNGWYSFYLQSTTFTSCSNIQPKETETTVHLYVRLPTKQRGDNVAWLQSALFFTCARSSYFHRDGNLKSPMNTSIPCFAVTKAVQRIYSRISAVRFGWELLYSIRFLDHGYGYDNMCAIRGTNWIIP